jgi:integrase
MYARNVAARGLDKAADRAGLNPGGEVPKLTLHDLRHTWISHLILGLKLDVVTVSRMAGHARPSITMDIYAGEFAETERGEDVAARMRESGFGAMLGGAGA